MASWSLEVLLVIFPAVVIFRLAIVLGNDLEPVHVG